ncbi:MAG: hypothetical protein ACI4NM_00230, partial [Bullifex sp.]
RLEREAERGVIPQSVMILGSPFSSRMTAAVETALFFLSEEDSYIGLDVQDLIILSNRNSQLRIKALLSVFKRSRNKRSWNMLLHETRLLLLSYHPALNESGDKDAFRAAGELGDHIFTYRDDFSDKELEKFIQVFEKLSSNLFSSQKKRSPFSIDQVRDIQAFLQLESERGKAVILENIEDVTAGAMNSLLKILEEPPKGAHLILVSRDPSRILDTILSRVRKYELPPISPALTKRFVMDTFTKDRNGTLEEYFYEEAGFDINMLKQHVADFVERSFIRKEKPGYEELNELTAFLDEADTYQLFMKALYEELMEIAVKERKPAAMRAANNVIGIYRDSSVYNQNRKIMIDRAERGIRNE